MKLKSGRVIDANRSILGLSYGTDRLEDVGTLFDGYDGIVDQDDGWGEPHLTPEERAEIAMVMLKRWIQWGGLEGITICEDCGHDFDD